MDRLPLVPRQSSDQSEVSASRRPIELWHKFGMEWKEHTAWVSPILATVVAFIALHYGLNLIKHERVRKTAMFLFVLYFAIAAIAGTLGAFITKVAPVR